MDLFDIDFHIFTVIKFLFNLGVRFKYILFKEIEKCKNLLLLDLTSTYHLLCVHGKFIAFGIKYIKIYKLTNDKLHNV